MSLPSSANAGKHKKLLVSIIALVFISLVGLGAMAKNGWLPHTDSLSGGTALNLDAWFSCHNPALYTEAT